MNKIIIFISFIFLTISLRSQIILNSNSNGTTVNTCNNTFYDSGSSNSSYQEGEDYVITICPDNPSNYLKANFTYFDVSVDELYVYNGNSTSSELIGVFSNITKSLQDIEISATSSNSSKCLTFRFVSKNNSERNNIPTGNGWAANITCGSVCQKIIAGIQSSAPALDNEGNIKVCKDELITLTAQGNYPDNGDSYTQSDVNSQFIWSIGNGQVLNEKTIQISFDKIKYYNIDLKIKDQNNCTSLNDIDLKAKVSTTPTFKNTVIQSNLCLGESTNINGVVTPQTYIQKIEGSKGESVALPDGIGVSYESKINLNSFQNGQILTDINQIKDICINIEHSSLGDLEIELICPNNNSVLLVEQSDNVKNIFLGEPVPWNNDIDVKGKGYDYCWAINPKTDSTIVQIGTAGDYKQGYMDTQGTNQNNKTYIPSGEYKSKELFDNLLGCPLNGEWKIKITDKIVNDNGFLFGSEINFNVDIANGYSYTPIFNPAQQSWSGSDIILNNGANITIQPQTAGQFNYTYTAIDDFGCTYDTIFKVNVVNPLDLNIGYDSIYCSINGLPILDAQSQGVNAQYEWYYAGNKVGTNQTYQIQNIADIGEYTLIIKNVYSCDITEKFNVSFDYPQIINLGIEDSICKNPGKLLDAGASANTYLWKLDNNIISHTQTINAIDSGVYFVEAKYNESCPDTGRVKLNLYPNIIVLANVSNDSCSLVNGKVVLNITGNTAPYTFLWDNSKGSNSSINNLSEGKYSVTITDKNNCVTNKSYDVSTIKCEIEIPNIITPNADGINDFFEVKGINSYKEVNLIVLNRWGNKVYENENYENDNKWDGTKNGKVLPVGTYFYIIRVNGNEYKGNLTILR